jgi:hypothetical protein
MHASVRIGGTHGPGLRAGGWDREVDGGGGAAVKDEAVQVFFIVGSVLIFLLAFGVGLFLAAS